MTEEVNRHKSFIMRKLREVENTKDRLLQEDIMDEMFTYIVDNDIINSFGNEFLETVRRKLIELRGKKYQQAGEYYKSLFGEEIPDC